MNAYVHVHVYAYRVNVDVLVGLREHVPHVQLQKVLLVVHPCTRFGCRVQGSTRRIYGLVYTVVEGLGSGSGRVEAR